MQNAKKLLSVLLAGVMLAGMLPLAALAANDTTAAGWTEAESGAVEVVSQGVASSAKVYALAQDAKVYEITLTGKLTDAKEETVTVGLPFTGSASYRTGVYQVGGDTGSYSQTLPAGITTAKGSNSQKTYYAIPAGSSVTFSVKAGSSYYNVTSSVTKADAVSEVEVSGSVDKNGALTVEVSFSEALDETADEIKVDLAASSGTASSVSATLPQAAVQALKGTNAAVTLGCSGVGSITLPAAAVTKLNANDKLIIAPTAKDQQDSKWTAATAFAMDFSITNNKGKVDISGLTKNPIKLSFPVPSALTGLTSSNVRVFHYENGKYERMSGAAYDSKTQQVSFTTPHLSSFVVMTEETARALGIEVKFEVTAPTANANVPGSMKVTATADAGNYVTFNVLSSKVGGYYVTVKAGADGAAEINAQLKSGDRVFAFVTKGELKLGANKLPEGVLATKTVTAK